MTEQERFDRCLAVVLRLEGGYGEDPRDPGGATNLGVTRATLSRVLGRAVSRAEVRALTPAEAGRIYRERYWRPAGCADLASGLDLMVFDAAVNMGPGAAARLLQAAVGAEVDGTVGPCTLAAAERAPAAVAILAMAKLRRERYRALPGHAVFGRGWMNRLRAVEALALDWARAAPPPLSPQGVAA